MFLALLLAVCAPGSACQVGTLQLGPTLQGLSDGGLAPVCSASLRGTVGYYRGGTVLDGGIYTCPATGTKWAAIGSFGGGVSSLDAGGEYCAGPGGGTGGACTAGSYAVTDAGSALAPALVGPGGGKGLYFTATGVCVANTGVLYNACFESQTLTLQGLPNQATIGAPQGIVVSAGSGYVSFVGPLRTTGTDTPILITEDVGLQSTGVAHASLTPPATAIAGTQQWDTTHQRLVVTDGGQWNHLALLEEVVTVVTPFFSGVCFGTCGEEPTGFVGSYSPSGAWTTSKLTCAWGTAGTGGTTGVVGRLYDETGATEACSCTLGACTTAASTGVACSCVATLSAAKVYRLELKSTTDCTINPSNIVCNVD